MYSGLFISSQSFFVALEIVKNITLVVIGSGVVRPKDSDALNGDQGILIAFQHHKSLTFAEVGISIIRIKLDSLFISIESIIVTPGSIKGITFIKPMLFGCWRKTIWGNWLLLVSFFLCH